MFGEEKKYFFWGGDPFLAPEIFKKSQNFKNDPPMTSYNPIFLL